MKPILIAPVNNMDSKKSKQNKPIDEMSLKLVVKRLKVGGIETKFYLGDTNVTPQEPTNIKYEFVNSNEHSLSQRMLSKVWGTQVEQEQESHLNTFRHLNIKTLDNLLDNIFSRQQYHNVEEPKECKYDIGENILLSKDNISNDSFEIELTESSTFNILNVPGSVTVKGDGDYERLQKSKEVYLNNLAKPRIKIDNISQTINSLMEREDVECQTSIVITCTAGTQVHNFNIIDTFNEMDVKQIETTSMTISEVPRDDVPEYKLQSEVAEDYRLDTTMFLERILAQNSLDVKLFWSNDIETTNRDDEAPVHKKDFGLKYCFTLKLLGDVDKGIAVRYMHWNEIEKHLLAVVYCKLIYTDYTDKQYASVAVWSTKNQHTPERFYEFNLSAITCIKFSTETPNYLAIGFDCGKILVIDISRKSLEIVFETSTKLSLETTSISELFWTTNTQNKIPEAKSECLMACNTIGCISRYCYLHGKLIMKLSDSLTQDNQLEKNLKETKPYTFLRVTKFIELDQNTDLVGTANGLVYSFSYGDFMIPSTQIVSHFGIIKSLEKSPFSQDVYLTTGYDCNINIWIGDVFLEPVITLSVGKQIEKAIWSRTSSTIIASIINNCIHVWDLSVTKYDPIFVQEMPNPNHRCTGLEFTSDGKHLCVSDISGKVVVYVLSNISSFDEDEEQSNLVYIIAKLIYGQKKLISVLIKERKKYAEAFIKLDYEKTWT